MAEEIENPLTESDFTNLRERMKDLDKADALIAKMKAAGIETGDALKTSTDYRTQILKIGQAFFPGRPIR